MPEPEWAVGKEGTRKETGRGRLGREGEQEASVVMMGG